MQRTNNALSKLPSVPLLHCKIYFADIPSRPDRPHPHLGPEHVHPAMREKGRMFHGEEGKQLRRTIEKDLRVKLLFCNREKNKKNIFFKPGPVPGMRPAMGGPGIQPQNHKGQGGAMSVLMPLYTVGIIIFFVYTVMKVGQPKIATRSFP